MPRGTVATRRALTLRPGLHVVRRDDRHLQVGLDPPDRLVVPDLPGLQQALLDPERPASPEVAAVVDRLADDGWLVDRREAHARVARSAPGTHAVAVLADAAWAEPLARCCSDAGVSADARDADALRLVATLGEPRRATSDGLVRDDVPHLWLAILPGRVRVGPFVEPGATACLRCLDAHLGDRDPRRATVLLQLESLPPSWFSPDPCLLRIGAAWAVRDVVRRLDGGLPSLRSATVTVTDDLRVERHDWLRHPHCGCAWG